MVLVHTRENSSFAKCQFQPLCRLCVKNVVEAAKESALFVHYERSEQISQEKLRLHPSVKSPDADVDEDYDEGFEDED